MDQFTGSFPRDFYNLKNLTTLEIINNKNLVGTLSPQITSFAKLENLRIEGMDGMTGSIPDEFQELKNLSTLKEKVLIELMYRLQTFFSQIV